MQDPRLADHAVGLELQLGELVEQRERALVQHRQADATTLQHAIDQVQAELAETAERLAEFAPHADMHGVISA